MMRYLGFGVEYCFNLIMTVAWVYCHEKVMHLILFFLILKIPTLRGWIL